jgi:protein-tyrosine-phosphatase
MLGYMLVTLAESSGDDWSVGTAGTLVSEGYGMSARTRDALIGIPELRSHPFTTHRSHRLSGDDVEWCDLILTMEASHVLFVRSHYPNAAGKTVLFGQFLREAPLDLPLREQVSIVSSLDPDAAYDVADPAGGDQGVYDACAQQLWEMAQTFVTLVDSSLG